MQCKGYEFSYGYADDGTYKVEVSKDGMQVFRYVSSNEEDQDFSLYSISGSNNQFVYFTIDIDDGYRYVAKTFIIEVLFDNSIKEIYIQDYWYEAESTREYYYDEDTDTMEMLYR